jgi:hypothetical protein
VVARVCIEPRSVPLTVLDSASNRMSKMIIVLDAIVDNRGSSAVHSRRIPSLTLQSAMTMATSDQDQIRAFGRKIIGSILRTQRERAGLTTRFASASPLKISNTMVRMIEAGLADVPVGKIQAYAEAISVKEPIGGPFVDGEILAAAYSSLKLGISTGRFEWQQLLNKPNEAREHFKSQLTRKQPYGGQRGTHLPSEFAALNPFQSQLLREIAIRVQAFGNDIISDAAVANWEGANKGLQAVLAAGVSLGSEFSDKFVESTAELLKRDNFENLRYLVASNDAHAVERVWSDLKRRVSKFAPEVKRETMSSKMEYKVITVDQFKKLGADIASTTEGLISASDLGGWDAFYLYKIISEPDLLIGTFRRLPALKQGAAPVTLRDWGAIPVNEALPWSAALEFEARHDELWHP